MSDFPRKIFEMPIKDDPRPDIYKELTAKNNDYKISDMGTTDCWLPDFSRAVELGNYIYRINVPGYFYKCPSGSSMSSGSKSGIVIDAFNMVMDTVSHHDHRVSVKSSNSSDVASGPHLSIRNAIYLAEDPEYLVKKAINTKATERVIENEDSFLSKKFQLSITCIKDNTYTGDHLIPIDGKNDKYKPENESVFNGNVIVNGVTCNVAVLANQRRCPEYSLSGNGKPFARDRASNYVVHTGKNDCGGIMNSLIPIIPGVATTRRPLACNCLSESTLAVVSKIAKIGSNYYYIDLHDYLVSCAVEGLLEARGTYVFANKTADKIFFVPAKSVGNTVKPITKIRETTSTSCTYNIPDGGDKDSDVRYLGEVGPTTTATMHYQGKAYCVWCKEADKKFVGTMNKVEYTSTANYCYIYYRPHDSSFDQAFRDIFANPPSDLKVGLKEKFIAQILELEDWPGTSNEDVDDIVGHATVKVKDPTSDGAAS